MEGILEITQFPCFSEKTQTLKNDVTRVTQMVRTPNSPFFLLKPCNIFETRRELTDSSSRRKWGNTCLEGHNYL